MMNSFNLNVISYYVIDIFSVIFREMIREEKFDCPATLVQRSKVAPKRRGEENYVTRRKKKKKKKKANKGKCTGRASTKELSRTMAATVDAQFRAFSRFPREICPVSADTLQHSKTLPPIEVRS